MTGCYLDQAIIREMFNYGPESGVLSWRRRPASHFSSEAAAATFNTRFFGQPVGSSQRSGYLMVSIKGKHYAVHRLIWIFVNGGIQGEIDHINGDRSDNRIANLRDVDRQANTRNSKLSVRNKSGRVGVRWSRSSKKWIAEIRDNKNIRLGNFDFFEEASEARSAAEVKYGYHPNHGRRA